MNFSAWGGSMRLSDGKDGVELVFRFVTEILIVDSPVGTRFNYILDDSC